MVEISELYLLLALQKQHAPARNQSGKKKLALIQKNARKLLVEKVVQQISVMMKEKFATMEPFSAHARTAFTTPLTNYVTPSRIVRLMNSNSKISVSPVLLAVLLAKQQTR